MSLTFLLFLVEKIYWKSPINWDFEKKEIWDSFFVSTYFVRKFLVVKFSHKDLIWLCSFLARLQDIKKFVNLGKFHLTEIKIVMPDWVFFFLPRFFNKVMFNPYHNTNFDDFKNSLLSNIFFSFHQVGLRVLGVYETK